MNKFTKVVRWATRWAWAFELGACEGMAKLQKIEADMGEDGLQSYIETQIKTDPSLNTYIATVFASLVADSPNYTEMVCKMTGKWNDKWEWLTITIQKGSGQTPHQLRMEAEARVNRLSLQLKELLDSQSKS